MAAAKRRLAVHVTVASEPGGAGFATFGPDDDVPKWAAEQMGDHVWAGKAAEPTEPAPTEVPPKGGAGSGRDEWAAYAASLEVAVEDGDTRDDIVEKLAAAGHPVDRA